MLDNRGVDLDPGWINRRLHDLARDLESLRSERRAAATMISAGDYTVTGGGSVRVLDGGGVAVTGGGSVSVAGGLLEVTGGGDIVIRDGGTFETRHPNGNLALSLGPMITGGGNPAQGLIMRDPLGAFVATLYSDEVNGERVVLFGSSADRLKLAQILANEVLIYGSNPNTYLWITPTGDVQLQPDVANGKSVIIGHNTTANAANTYMDSVGRVYRSTSSRRYKQDERPADIDVSKVLALQPRVFRSRDEVEDEGEAAPTHVGFIAEEAADLGLDLWVSRDEAGDPESFAYPLWGVAQQAVIQAQQAQIDALTAQVAALSEQVAALSPTPTTTTKRTL